MCEGVLPLHLTVPPSPHRKNALYGMAMDDITVAVVNLEPPTDADLYAPNLELK